MSQEPWNEEIYHSPENSRRTRKDKPTISTRIFTILAVIFLIIVLIITCIALFLSNGGSTTNSSQEFHNTSTATSSTEASSAVSSSSVASSSSTSTTSSSSTTTTSSTLTDTGDGTTITVLEGEGAASIAARAGITVEELYALNPDKMVGPGNTWWANPGDVVRIR